MKKSDIKSMPRYFDRYINQVADIELAQAFAESIEQLNSLDRNLLEKFSERRYEPDKWTPKEIFQHIIDFERILSYRALLFARKEGSIPQSIDQNLLAENMNANARRMADLIDELKIARLSTKSMFDSFDDEMLQNAGINWKSEMSVLAMGFAILGHQIHHLKIIEEKYLSLQPETL